MTSNIDEQLYFTVNILSNFPLLFYNVYGHKWYQNARYVVAQSVDSIENYLLKKPCFKAVCRCSFEEID